MELQTRDFGLTVRKADAETRTMEFVCSTDAVDSYGEIVEQDWDLTRYAANPVVLFEHGHASGMFGGDPLDKLPIGKASNVRVEKGQLVATVTFLDEKANPRAPMVFEQYRQGGMNAVSVGFTPKDLRVEKRDGVEVCVLSQCELYEISLVSIPANAEAVARRRKSADALRARAVQPKTPAATAAATEPTDMTLDLIAKRLGCEPTEAAIVLAIEAREKAAAPIFATATLSSFAPSILGLADTASEGEVAKTVAGLQAKAAKADELEPKLVAAEKALAAVEAEKADAEVDFLVRRGGAYGFAFTETSRKALKAYRTHDAAGFAEEYKAALDGMRAHDKPELLAVVTAKGGPLAPPASSPNTAADPGNGLDAIERAADALQEKAVKAGRTLSRTEALRRAASEGAQLADA